MNIQTGRRGKFMRGMTRSFLCAAASLSLVASASAADVVEFLKAPPVIPDFTWKGVTVYGTYDIGGQYEAHGAPTGGNGAVGIITQMNRGPQWLIVPNQSSQTAVGVKIDQNITQQLHFIARFETGFNSTTGELSDTMKGMQKNNGIPLSQQTANGGGPRAGQLINGEAWAGFQDKTWGELHIGRNNMISTDMTGAYDPLASYGFSLLGYFGLLAGQGSSDTARIDQSIKYLNNFGPWRMSVVYGKPETNVKEFYQGSVGFVRPNFSVDVIAGHGSDLVSTFALSGSANINSKYLGAKVFDSDMVGAFGKYVFDLGHNGLQDPAERKFTVTGGYARVDYSNPADGGYGVGHSTIGGYEIGPILATNGSTGSGIVNYGFTGGDRIVNVSFITGKYQHDAQWSAAVGYYRYDQKSYALGVNSIPGIVAPGYSSVACFSRTFINCAGAEQVASFRIDYDWTKNFRLYAGVAYSRVDGGFGFSYLNNSTFDPTVGMKISF